MLRKHKCSWFMLTVSPNGIFGRYVGLFVETFCSTSTPRQGLCEKPSSGIYMHDMLARAWHARGQPTTLSMHESVKKTLIVGCAPDNNPSLDLDCMSDWVGFAAAVTEVHSL
jgi:hypothetical protein